MSADVKRMIGRSFGDVFAQKNDIEAWPFKVTQGPGQRPIVVFAHNADEKNFSAEQLYSMILIKLRETAQDYLGTTAKLGAVITVPACFNDCQRQSTFDAAVNAGLEVLGIISEPCAAALAYGLVHEGPSGKNVLFFDLGGGKFEVSMVRIENGIVKLKATCGEAQLGGIDFDNRMVLSFANEFSKENNKDILQSVRALSKLRLASQAAKISLSTEEKHTISIMSLYEGLDFNTTVTRADFETWFEDIFQRCLQLVNTCVKNSVMEKGSVDEIVLLGRSSGMPKMRAMLKNCFGNNIYISSSGSSHLVAYGATLRAASLSGQHNVDVHKLMGNDFYPLRLVLKAEAVSRISSRATLAYKHGSYAFFRAESIPANYMITFPTILDNQHSIWIKVKWYDHNYKLNSLAEFELSGIPPAKKGGLEIRLFFDINPNGILNVYGAVNAKVHVKVPDSNKFKKFLSKHTKRKDKNCSGAADSIEGNGHTLTCVKRWFPQEDMQSVEDVHVKRVKANKSLKEYVYGKKDLFQDYPVVSLFEEITTSKKIEDAINETSKWLDDHGCAEAEDCTKKMMELNSCIWWATLRDYALKMKKRMDDEENIDDSDKAELVSTLDYVLKWLERYPSAEGERIADQRKYIEDLHRSILAKTALKRYISVLATQTSDDSGEYSGIQQQIEEALGWIENSNTPAATYEAEHKKLQRNFNSVTAKSLLSKCASEMFLY